MVNSIWLNADTICRQTCETNKSLSWSKTINTATSHQSGNCKTNARATRANIYRAIGPTATVRVIRYCPAAGLLHSAASVHLKTSGIVSTFLWHAFPETVWFAQKRFKLYKKEDKTSHSIWNWLRKLRQCVCSDWTINELLWSNWQAQRARTVRSHLWMIYKANFNRSTNSC